MPGNVWTLGNFHVQQPHDTTRRRASPVAASDSQCGENRRNAADRTTGNGSSRTIALLQPITALDHFLQVRIKSICYRVHIHL